MFTNNYLIGGLQPNHPHFHRPQRHSDAAFYPQFLEHRLPVAVPSAGANAHAVGDFEVG